MDLCLKDKVAIISGTNNPKGIGATTALAFASVGVKVVMVYKRMEFPFILEKSTYDGIDSYHKALSEDCSIVEEKIKKITSNYLVIEGDISNSKFVSSLFEQSIQKFGKVDILVNNAATYALNDTIFNVSDDDVNNVFDTNIKGTLYMIREFVKRFSGYGRIINLSTDAAQIFAGQITYGSSKATIEALTRSIAVEVGNLGITVNTIAPGPIQTGWIDNELEKAVSPNIPISRLGKPQDITNLILFLSSNKAAWLTGQVIKVSGGHCL